MNILYIITGLGIGGAEKVTVDLANLMQDKGNNVAILYLYGDNQYTSLIYYKYIIGEKWTQIYSLFSSDKKSRNENFTNYNS